LARWLGVELERPGTISREQLALLRPRLGGLRFDHLYVLGNLEALAAPSVAMVGSRAPSERGRRLARATASNLAARGVCVVSGLALGIDGAAHEGALDACAPTIGVLGGGHRRFYPQRNRRLAERMLEGGGAVVSPFPPEQDAFPAQFLQRNAIVAALADAVVVVEAAARSGALNTAGWAADLGLPVLAFPGDVDRPKVAGCLALIRDGATLVRGADDILAAIGISDEAAPCSENHPVATGSGPVASVGPDERALRKALRAGHEGIEELALVTGLDPSRVAAAMVRLELAGDFPARKISFGIPLVDGISFLRTGT